MPKKTINILGVTGSIGESTAKVILSNPDAFDVNVISGHSNRAALADLKDKLGAKYAICTQDEDVANYLDEAVDLTVSAITGFAGLRPLLKAIEVSKAVGIANKEPLVAAGPLVMQACKKYHTQILPIDSEHNAIFQVFDESNRDGIERIILTASGGPFRTWDKVAIENATPEQAIAHPNWTMGKKISVDSASMMNKALEVIEAHILFDMTPGAIDVLVHPQSVVHSMVEYSDGSILSQMGASDMCTPIAYALSWPQRMKTPGQRLDLARMGQLEFEALDDNKFPAILYAKQAIESGLGACVALNAANEVAVHAFLEGNMHFGGIMDCVSFALEDFKQCGKSIANDAFLEDIEELDLQIRSNVNAYIDNEIKRVKAG